MAFAFKTLPARPAFGTYTSTLDAGEYILMKRARAAVCNSQMCPGKPVVSTQGELSTLNQAKRLDAHCFIVPFNKRNLNINLITTLDLSGCCIIQTIPASPNLPVCPANVPQPADITNLFYVDFTIDPYGCLFGETLCNANNYLKRLRYSTVSP